MSSSAKRKGNASPASAEPAEPPADPTTGKKRKRNKKASEEKEEEESSHIDVVNHGDDANAHPEPEQKADAEEAEAGAIDNQGEEDDQPSPTGEGGLEMTDAALNMATAIVTEDAKRLEELKVLEGTLMKWTPTSATTVKAAEEDLENLQLLEEQMAQALVMSTDGSLANEYVRVAQRLKALKSAASSKLSLRRDKEAAIKLPKEEKVDDSGRIKVLLDFNKARPDYKKYYHRDSENISQFLFDLEETFKALDIRDDVRRIPILVSVLNTPKTGAFSASDLYRFKTYAEAADKVRAQFERPDDYVRASAELHSAYQGEHRQDETAKEFAARLLRLRSKIGPNRPEYVNDVGLSNMYLAKLKEEVAHHVRTWHHSDIKLKEADGEQRWNLIEGWATQSEEALKRKGRERSPRNRSLSPRRTRNRSLSPRRRSPRRSPPRRSPPRRSPPRRSSPRRSPQRRASPRRERERTPPQKPRDRSEWCRICVGRGRESAAKSHFLRDHKDNHKPNRQNVSAEKRPLSDTKKRRLRLRRSRKARAQAFVNLVAQIEEDLSQLPTIDPAVFAEPEVQTALTREETEDRELLQEPSTPTEEIFVVEATTGSINRKYLIVDLIVNKKKVRTLLDTACGTVVAMPSLKKILGLQGQRVDPIKLKGAFGDGSAVINREGLDLTVTINGEDHSLQARVQHINVEEFLGVHLIIGFSAMLRLKLIRFLKPPDWKTDKKGRKRLKYIKKQKEKKAALAAIQAQCSSQHEEIEEGKKDSYAEWRRGYPKPKDAKEMDVELAEPEKESWIPADAKDGDRPGDAESRAALEKKVQPLMKENEERPGNYCTLKESVVRIEMNDTNPVYKRQYPIPEAYHGKLTEAVLKLVKNDRAETTSDTRNNLPLLAALKHDKDGNVSGIRACLDCKPVNDRSVSIKGELPRIRDLLRRLGRYKIFSELDLKEAYQQFLVAAEDRDLLSFTWGGKRYRMKGCPYGLKNIPVHFQSIMNKLFEGKDYAVIYLDNIIIASQDWQQHEADLQDAIRTLTSVNLKLNAAKCFIGYRRLRTLGFLVSEGGSEVDPAKMQAVTDWPLPLDHKQLQTFVGFASYMRESVRNFADLTGEMEAAKLNKKAFNDMWKDPKRREQYEKSFKAVKQAISTAPTLRVPDWDRSIAIATDASLVGVGGCLYQPSKPGELPNAKNIISCVSGVLKKSQQAYSTFKKELYSVVYCLRKFSQWIHGRTFTLYTDHKALVSLLGERPLAYPLSSWMDTIAEFNFTVEHRPGFHNYVPDALSRQYEGRAWGSEEELQVDGVFPITRAMRSGPVEEKVPAARMKVEGKIIPPIEARKGLIDRYHRLGHFGREAVVKRLWRQRLWWPGLQEDVDAHLKECDTCLAFNTAANGWEPLHSPSAILPFDLLGVDTWSNFPASEGMTTVLVVIDYFTGFILLRPIKDKSAPTVARELLRIFCDFGTPTRIATDRGTEFTNTLVQEVLRLSGITHRLSAEYHHEQNGRVERGIRTVMTCVRKLLSGRLTDWVVQLPIAQLSYNLKISSVTNCDPFSLMFGRKNNILTEKGKVRGSSMSLDEWISEQKRLFDVVFPAVARRADGRRAVQNELANNRHRKRLQPFPNEAVVMLRNLDKETKTDQEYIGPYFVDSRNSHGTYNLRDADGAMYHRQVVASDLKLVSRVHRPQDGAVYGVRKILDHKESADGKFSYLVWWDGFSKRDSTWESAESFLNHKIIQNYHEQLEAKAELAAQEPSQQQRSNKRKAAQTTPIARSGSRRTKRA